MFLTGSVPSKLATSTTNTSSKISSENERVKDDVKITLSQKMHKKFINIKQNFNKVSGFFFTF